MGMNVVVVSLMVLVASIAPDIVLQEVAGSIPAWLLPAKIAVLAGLLAFSVSVKSLRAFWKFPSILIVILACQWLFDLLKGTPWWVSSFPSSTFAGNFGGTILLKLITVVPVVLVLRLLAGSWRASYLLAGDLSVKAEKIDWLGIKGNTINWAKLSLISAVLIALGTILLTVLTATNGAAIHRVGGLLGKLPLILLFAAVNSACEGIVYRSAILGTLKGLLPKGAVLLAAAVFFGIAHYYGVPSGWLGAAMSGVLGWYMSRSMYETEGFLSSWIIHCLQDVVIFSTLYLFGNFS